ncbi:CoA transferase [Lentzea sp. NPDC055074]
MTLHLDRTTSDPPLSATEITVRGDSAASDVLGALLHQSGASVSRFPDNGGEPAHVEAAASLTVTWAGPLTGVTDEASAQALCGLMHVHGRSQGSPRGLGLDYCATAAGVVGGTGLLAALFAGRSSVTTSVAQSALMTVSQYLAAAGAPEAEATALEPGGPPFRSEDGVLFEVEALDPAVWQAFWTRLGVPGKVIGAGWRPFQFRYPTATAPLPAELHAAAEARTFAELTAHAHATAMSICHLHEPNSVPGPAFELSVVDSAGSPRTVSAPGDLPLTGLVVLEAGRRVQAPLAAHLLGLLGATVVRVEPPGGDPLRGMPPVCGDTSARWLALNRGKSAVEIDIKDPADRDRLRDLVRTADVFLHNWAPGTAERLGLGAHDLAAVNPSLVFVHTSGWAGRVPDAPLGTDFMAQARTGLGALLRPADEPPAPSLMTLLDVLGGLLGAYTTVAALLQRDRTGQAIRAESSLLAAAELLRLRANGRPAPGFRRPLLGDGGWTHDGVPVTEDLASITTDPRFFRAVAFDSAGCPEVLTPWRFR